MYLSEVWKVAWICFRSSFRRDKSLFGSLNFLLSGFRVSFFTTYSSLIQSCRVVVTHSNFVYWDAAVRTNAFLINTQKKKKKKSRWNVSGYPRYRSGAEQSTKWGPSSLTSWYCRDSPNGSRDIYEDTHKLSLLTIHEKS